MSWGKEIKYKASPSFYFFLNSSNKFNKTWTLMLDPLFTHFLIQYIGESLNFSVYWNSNLIKICIYHISTLTSQTSFFWLPHHQDWMHLYYSFVHPVPFNMKYLWHDVASGSDIMPCNKIDTTLVVYRFSKLTPGEKWHLKTMFLTV